MLRRTELSTPHRRARGRAASCLMLGLLLLASTLLTACLGGGADGPTVPGVGGIPGLTGETPPSLREHALDRDARQRYKRTLAGYNNMKVTGKTELPRESCNGNSVHFQPGFIAFTDGIVTSSWHGPIDVVTPATYGFDWTREWEGAAIKAESFTSILDHVDPTKRITYSQSQEGQPLNLLIATFETIDGSIDGGGCQEGVETNTWFRGGRASALQEVFQSFKKNWPDVLGCQSPRTGEIAHLPFQMGNGQISLGDYKTTVGASAKSDESISVQDSLANGFIPTLVYQYRDPDGNSWQVGMDDAGDLQFVEMGSNVGEGAKAYICLL